MDYWWEKKNVFFLSEFILLLAKMNIFIHLLSTCTFFWTAFHIPYPFFFILINLQRLFALCDIYYKILAILLLDFQICLGIFASWNL